MVECAICRAPDAVLWFEKSGYPIRVCGSCRCAFVWPRPSAERLTAVYESAQYARNGHSEAEAQYFPSGRDDAELIVSRCEAFGSGRGFLDIGAGAGLLSRVAADHGFKVEAIEPNERQRELFFALNDVEPYAGFFDAKFADQMAGRYDVVVLSQVLEHLANPAAIPELLRRVLAPNGIVFIGVPHFGSLLSALQGPDDMYITPPEHLNFFSMEGLITLFRRNGFELAHMDTVSKTPVGRIKRVCKIWPFTEIGWRTAHALLSAANLFGMGMVLNGYFRVSQ